MDVEGLRNIFPLGCGTCLCFVRERCHLSVWEMETKYLLFSDCCLLGYCTDFWMKALQKAGTKTFCVHNKTRAVSSCIFLMFFSFFFSLFFFPNEKTALSTEYRLDPLTTTINVLDRQSGSYSSSHVRRSDLPPPG